MLEKKKTDPQLGLKVQEMLAYQGLQTPTKEVEFPRPHDLQKIDTIELHMRAILDAIGFDLEDDSMCDTPRRVAKMLVQEKFWGLDFDNFPKFTTFPNSMKLDQMVLERDIPIISSCEHHLEAIIGKATIAYIPAQMICGLSKLNRVAEFFAHRPQVQERLTQQIQRTLQFLLETEHVAVSITASHGCIACRGVSHMNCSTTTNAFGGVFLEKGKVRDELLHFL